MKTFEVPQYYKSEIVSKIKSFRKTQDPRKKDFSPSVLNFGPVSFYLARHFGFCYGVENAIEIAYKTIEQYPDKRIFFLSEMIHNPNVNEDLNARGVQFIMTTKGEQLIPWDAISSEDIVLIPAFGTSLETKELLKAKNIDYGTYDTTCPFVEKVWNRAGKLGQKDHSIIVHGKPQHEETKATFSHSADSAPTLIIKNLKEAELLAEIILDQRPISDFYQLFANRYSKGFDPKKDFEKIGVVNQTTMLASETQEIAAFIKSILEKKYGSENIKNHFADTRDTLCYATNDNQQSTLALLEESVDLVLVIGGYNSSNTSHLVELCETKFPTYFISDKHKIISETTISHFDLHQQKEVTTTDYLPNKENLKIIITSGASCPDSMLEQVLLKMLSFFDQTKSVEEVLNEMA